MSEPLLHDVVIVLAESVVGNLVFAWRQSARRCVVQGYDDDAACAGQQQGGVESLVDVVRQIVHVCMAALCYPLPVGRGSSLVDGACLGNAACRKAEAQGLLL